MNIKLLTNYKFQFGFSFLELLTTLAMVAVLSMIALNSYKKHLEKTDRVIAATEIAQIQAKINNYFSEQMEFPDSLNDLNLGDLLYDPWDTPYVYVDLSKIKGKGGARKDKNLVPINTDYDLYSKGPDKESKNPLTAKASKDDIIRANNGGYIGVAEDY